MTRLLAVRRESVSAEHLPLFDEIAGPGGELSPFYGLLMVSPRVAAAVRPLGAVLRGSVEPLLFDIIALSVGAVCRCPYEMAFHVKALRKAGFADDVLDAIGSGAEHASLSASQQLAATYAWRLAADRTVSETRFSEALSVFGAATLLEISALVGYIGLVSQLANSFDLRAG